MNTLLVNFDSKTEAAKLADHAIPFALLSDTYSTSLYSAVYCCCFCILNNIKDDALRNHPGNLTIPNEICEQQFRKSMEIVQNTLEHFFPDRKEIIKVTVKIILVTLSTQNLAISA